MKKAEVLNRLCSLVNTVNEKMFDSELEFTCFCGENTYANDLVKKGMDNTDEKLIKFIEDCVELEFLASGKGIKND